MATDSRTEKESSQMQEAGPLFQFMAKGNMWLLKFEASSLRVLADPWLIVLRLNRGAGFLVT